MTYYLIGMVCLVTGTLMGNTGRMLFAKNYCEFSAIWLTNTCMLELWIDGISFIDASIRVENNMDLWLNQSNNYVEIK